MGRGQIHQSSPTVCDGEKKRHRGLSLSRRPDHCKRVDAEPAGGRRSSSSLASQHRPVRYSSKFPPPDVFFPHDRSPKRGHGRLLAEVVESTGLRVSTSGGDQESAEQVQGVVQLSADSNSTLLASKRMVPGPDESVSRESFSSSIKTGPPKTTALPSVSQKPPELASSCMEAGIDLARAAGFSLKAAQLMAASRRKSTSLIYQGKWNIFRKWCETSKIDHSKPTLPVIADFLVYLFDVRKLSVTAIKGYRSMLSSVFFSVLPGITSSRFMKELVKGLENRSVKKMRSPFPSWSLAKTLEYLKGPVFEPLGSCDWRNLTKKTLFLVALATAKRIGELQAISHSVSFQSEDAVLSYLPEFVAKTETLKNPVPRSFKLKSLKVGRKDSAKEDALLCPVRALRIYLQRSKEVSPRPRSLFVSPRIRSKAITKNAISFFLRETIAQAGSLPTDQCRAHDVRGISTSASFWTNWPLDKILEAASWKSANVFAKHYLKDMESAAQECSSVGPFTTAGLKVHGTNNSHS